MPVSEDGNSASVTIIPNSKNGDINELGLSQCDKDALSDIEHSTDSAV